MNCDQKETCPVFNRHGDKLCQRLYCQDKCPKSTITQEEYERAVKK